MFVFENVLGLLSAKNEDGTRYFDQMISLFKEAGYITDFKLVNASDFGVLQNRKRVILIGKKGKETGFYPEFEKIDKRKTALVKEVLEDLPEIQAGSGDWYNVKYKNKGSDYVFDACIRNGIDFTTQHIARPHNEQDKEIYRIAVRKWNSSQDRLDYNDLPEELKSHNNRHSFVDRFKVVAPDLTKTQTIVAHIAKDGHYYIHPDINQNRSLTPREAARLQTFPDDFYFEENLCAA
jgi:DNA (cytosine-5)-methyltransferase 1